MTLRLEPGWTGLFTRAQARGAIPNGTRVYKTVQETSDAHPVGAQAIVLGSIDTSNLPPPRGRRQVRFMYFVEWDDRPRIACGISDFRIGVVG